MKSLRMSIKVLSAKKMLKNTEELVGLLLQDVLKLLLILYCVLLKLLKSKCKSLPRGFILKLSSLLIISLFLKMELSLYTTSCLLFGLDKSLTPLSNLLHLNKLQNSSTLIFSLNLKMNTLRLNNCQSLSCLVIQLVSSVPSFLILLTLWFLR